MTVACPYVEVLEFPPAKLSELQGAWACVGLYVSFILLLNDCEAHLCLQTFGQTCCGSQLPSPLELPLSVLRGVGEECCVSQGELGEMWRKLVASFANPTMCSVQWNLSHKGFSWVQGHHSQPVCAFTHLSHAPWVCNWEAWFSGKIVQIVCHCEISHTHRVMSCESTYFPKQQSLATLSLSVVNIWRCGWPFFYFKYRWNWLEGYKVVKKAFSKTVWNEAFSTVFLES